MKRAIVVVIAIVALAIGARIALGAPASAKSQVDPPKHQQVDEGKVDHVISDGGVGGVPADGHDH